MWPRTTAAGSPSRAPPERGPPSPCICRAPSFAKHFSTLQPSAVACQHFSYLVSLMGHYLRLGQHGRKGDVRPLRAVGGSRRIRRPLERLRTARTDQEGVGAGRSGGRGNRFHVKWFQPVKPSTGSPLRMKTIPDWVISPISVRETSTFLARMSRAG